ncbi:MAG TPA: SPFH domain-containing protein [Oligoflexia bacterium]|nr:SPFH domain-containing protein [Oligoflexia bacterium]HMP27843.1 SPFH domain-containing protein [Oligoflexia bacterium]
MLTRLFVVLSFAFILTGCDTGVQQLAPSEVGVLFRKLPPIAGGGISQKVINRGQLVVVWPWDSIYRFDTRLKEIAWGQRVADSNASDFVQTRALDGNEVMLAVKVQYSIADNSQAIAKLVNEVAVDDEEIRKIVFAVGRADIRTYMNELRTASFFDNRQKFEAGEKVKQAMQERLKPYGIIIHNVNLGEHRFERILPDGTIDSSYQERINEVQTLEQQTQREKLRKATVEADKEREYNNMQAAVNRELAEAEGFKRQAQLEGDGYYAAKANEAKAILAAGQAEVEGMIKQIAAFAGAGGRSLLKLEIAKQLKAGDSKFLTFDQGSASATNSVGVKKVDLNQLAEQIGLFEGLKESSRKKSARKDDKEGAGDDNFAK